MRLSLASQRVSNANRLLSLFPLTLTLAGLTMSDSDDDAAIARLEAELAQKKERKRAREDEQRRREALVPKQLVPDSPSPSACTAILFWAVH